MLGKEYVKKSIFKPKKKPHYKVKMYTVIVVHSKVAKKYIALQYNVMVRFLKKMCRYRKKHTEKQTTKNMYNIVNIIQV